MTKDLSRISLLDSRNQAYLGEALICPQGCECAYVAIGQRDYVDYELSAFVEGARYGDNDIVVNNINMPILIDSLNTPYNEIRNTIVKELGNRYA